eukprot:scaffold1318_cov388-Prasinococcus_capsulatus_cf.AAC.38
MVLESAVCEGCKTAAATSDLVNPPRHAAPRCCPQAGHSQARWLRRAPGSLDAAAASERACPAAPPSNPPADRAPRSTRTAD